MPTAMSPAETTIVIAIDDRSDNHSLFQSQPSGFSAPPTPGPMHAPPPGYPAPGSANSTPAPDYPSPAPGYPANPLPAPGYPANPSPAPGDAANPAPVDGYPSPAPGYPAPGPVPPPPPQREYVYVQDNIMLALLTTWLCSAYIGIFAIWKSIQARDAVVAGDVSRAETAANCSKKLSYVSIALGVISFVVTIILIIFVNAAYSHCILSGVFNCALISF